MEADNIKKEIGRCELNPKHGLSFLKLGMNINLAISEIKYRGIVLLQTEISGSVNYSENEPLFIFLPSLSAKLQFDSYFQELELIEIGCLESDNTNRVLGIEYQGKTLVEQYKKSSLNYSNILDIFGPNSLPSFINNNEKILVKYDGVTFVFNNYQNYIQNEFDIAKLGNNIQLSSIYIFSKKCISESILDSNGLIYSIKKLCSFYYCQMLNNISHNNPNCIRNTNIPMLWEIKEFSTRSSYIIFLQQGRIILKAFTLLDINYSTRKSSDESNSSNPELDNSIIIISLGDNYDSLKQKLKNPNNIYYCKKHVNENQSNQSFSNKSRSNYPQENVKNEVNNYTINKLNSFFSTLTSNPNTSKKNIILENNDCDFFVNYFDLGLDFLIDNDTLRIKKIIIHNNNYYHSNFGFYKRANFVLNVETDFFKKINDDDSNSNTNQYFSESRKNSELSNVVNESNDNNTGLNINFNTNDALCLVKVENITLYKTGVSTIPEINNSTPTNISSDKGTLRKQFVIPNNNPITNITTVKTNLLNSTKSSFKTKHLDEQVNSTNNTITNIKTNLSTSNNISNMNKIMNTKRILYNPPLSKRLNGNNGINSGIRNINQLSKTDIEKSFSQKDMTSDSQNNTLIVGNDYTKYKTICLLPTSNFYTEFLTNAFNNSYFYFMKTDSNIGILSHYFVFDWFAFEVMENKQVETITIYNSTK